MEIDDLCVVNNRKFEAEDGVGRKHVIRVCGVFFVPYMMISSIVCVCLL